jgi:hypothetical protein
VKPTGAERLTVVPCTLEQANTFVRVYHRHHGPRQGHLLSVAVADEDGRIRGVATVSRPSARQLQDGLTVEIVRVCTDGVANGNSALYGACRRIVTELGYVRGLTYILESETGITFKAIAWRWLWTTKGGLWDTPARRRENSGPSCRKQAWGWGDWAHIEAYRKAHPEEFAA